MSEPFDYFELEDNCYFVESTSSIVNTAEDRHFKLGSLAAFVTKFLVLKVRKDIIAQILVDHGVENLSAANGMIGQVITNLGGLIMGVVPTEPLCLTLNEPTCVEYVRQTTNTRASTLRLAIATISHGI